MIPSFGTEKDNDNDDDESGLIELVCKVPLRKGPMIQEKEHENLLKLGSSVTEAPKFEEISKELGLKLLNPLYGKCFNHVIIIYCIFFYS